jgi:hypothetical protein
MCEAAQPVTDWICFQPVQKKAVDDKMELGMVGHGMQAAGCEMDICFCQGESRPVFVTSLVSLQKINFSFILPMLLSDKLPIGRKKKIRKCKN